MRRANGFEFSILSALGVISDASAIFPSVIPDLIGMWQSLFRHTGEDRYPVFSLLLLRVSCQPLWQSIFDFQPRTKAYISRPHVFISPKNLI
jgi:hypothetical protein